jgi:formylglycine-generating enzyme required for sulfatase activity/Tfp pilus assembly protein PilF
VANHNVGEAEASARRAIELGKKYPKDAGGYGALGYVGLEKGDWDGAVANFRAAIAIQPDVAGLIFNLGVAYERRGDLTEAAKCYRKAIALDPTWGEAHLYLGDLLLLQGDLKGAEAIYRTLIGFWPDSAAELYIKLGAAYGKRGDLAEAEKWYRKAVTTSDQDQSAKRQASEAVALLRMDRAEKVWPLLKHSPDPRVRSYLIHALGPLGADARTIVKHLNREPDVTIRRALLLSLGEFGEKLTREERQALLPQLQDMYRTAPDAGLHAAAEWLLRQWKEDAWLNEANKAWAGDKQHQLKRLETIEHELKKETGKDETRWYVNGQGQTLVVIPGPVEFWMGSPPAEEGRAGGPGGNEELRHWRRFGRSFAIASKEVTVEQFLRFRKDHRFDGRAATSADCPVNMVTWYDAAAYCNWLSEQEGIPKDQWCYEPNTEGNYAQGMKMATNYLQRTGYRLPTEAEWEFSCRAGAATRYFFGESDELLLRYGWYGVNSQDKLWPAGSLKPNDFGLFDMHGNVVHWCQESYKPYDIAGEGRATEDIEDVADPTDGNARVRRGGSALWGDRAPLLRSAMRRPTKPSERHNNQGFRPVRTLPFRSFDRYAAARAAAPAACAEPVAVAAGERHGRHPRPGGAGQTPARGAEGIHAVLGRGREVGGARQQHRASGVRPRRGADRRGTGQGRAAVRRCGEGEASTAGPHLAEGRDESLGQARCIRHTPRSAVHCTDPESLAAGHRPRRHPRCGGAGQTPGSGTEGLQPVVGGRGGVVEEGDPEGKAPGEGVTCRCEIRENAIFRVLQPPPGVVTLL